MDSKITEFSDYLANNYIDFNATFPIWVALENNVWRTNNISEAFNYKFKIENRSPHPYKSFNF